MRHINLIVIHCSATPIDQQLSSEKLAEEHAARGIRRPGGYHLYIRRNGDIVNIRPFNEVGAHAYGYNPNSVGICYEGGIIAGGHPNNPKHAKDTRTDSQKESLKKAIKMVQDYFGDYQDMTVVQIVGHRDLSPDVDGDGIIEPWEYMKQCPCFDAIPEYKSLIIK